MFDFDTYAMQLAEKNESADETFINELSKILPLSTRFRYFDTKTNEAYTGSDFTDCTLSDILENNEIESINWNSMLDSLVKTREYTLFDLDLKFRIIE